MKTDSVSLKNILWDLRFVLITLLVIELICGLISLNYSQLEQFRIINAWHHEWADYFFRIYTHIGDGLFVVFVAVGLLFVKVRYAIVTLTSFLLSGLVAQLIKRSVKLARPGTVLKDDPNWYTLPDYHIHGNYSFPSGHTTTIFALMIVLYYIFPKQRSSPLLFTLACLAGYSRVYLSQHWTGDVYGGALVGTVVTVVVLYWFENSRWYHTRWADRGLLKKY